MSTHSARLHSDANLQLQSNKSLIRSLVIIPHYTRRQKVKLFFWNKREGTVCYRKKSSWIFICTFYPLFASVILLIFFGLMTMINQMIHAYAGKQPLIDKQEFVPDMPKFLAHRNVPSTTSTASAFYFERRPENLSKWESFQKYVWDSEHRTCCNRGGLSWCYLICFYFTFLSILMGFFFATMLGMVYIIKSAGKPWTDNSVLTDPHLG